MSLTYTIGSNMTSNENIRTTSAQRLLYPLQQTADRVSRQVEEFAKCLDKFNVSREPADQTLWNDAETLLRTYKEIALARRHQTPSAPRSRPSSGDRQQIDARDTEARQVQLEADLWALTANLLDCACPQVRTETLDCQKTVLERLHSYSTNLEIWQAFISSDSFAQESQMILDWLQSIVPTSRGTIEEIVRPLTVQAERGDGVWSAGWLYTKMAVKVQKRSRSWPKPLEPRNAGINVSHTRTGDSKPLVTQLDPDAVTREGNLLQPQDVFHEQAAWRALWEMLRRGETLGDCRLWWSERKEIWRAVLTRGADVDWKKLTTSPWYRMVQLPTLGQWFERCRRLSKDGVDIDEYQSAVFGVLSGNATGPLKVCQTIDDNLFVYFNSVLIQRYLDFIEVYQRKLKQPDKTENIPQSGDYQQVRKYLVYAQTDQSTREESRSPHKSIESAIISKDFDAFFVRQGQAAAQVAHPDGDSKYLIEKDDVSPVNDCAQITARNPDSLRLIAHLQLLLKSLGYLEEAYNNHINSMENNIVAYIGWLHKEGKNQLIPLYASNLSPERAASVMGAIVMDITDPVERNRQVRLMENYGISVSDFLWAQWLFANAGVLDVFMTKGVKINPVSVIQYVGTGKAKYVKIRNGFMGEDVSEHEERAIRTLEWYQYADKPGWGKACYAASSIYKIFIMQGRLAAARALSESARLADISKAAIGMDLGSSDSSAAASEDGDLEMDGVPHEERAHSISPKKKGKEQKKPDLHILTRPGQTREGLAAKAQSWRQLEQLVDVLIVLEVWIDIADNVERFVSPI